MRYRLRTLMILTALGPPVLAGLLLAGGPVGFVAALLVVTPVLLYFWIVM